MYGTFYTRVVSFCVEKDISKDVFLSYTGKSFDMRSAQTLALNCVSSLAYCSSDPIVAPSSATVKRNLSYGASRRSQLHCDREVSNSSERHNVAKILSIEEVETNSLQFE